MCNALRVTSETIAKRRPGDGNGENCSTGWQGFQTSHLGVCVAGVGHLGVAFGCVCCWSVVNLCVAGQWSITGHLTVRTRTCSQRCQPLHIGSNDFIFQISFWQSKELNKTSRYKCPDVLDVDKFCTGWVLNAFAVYTHFNVRLDKLIWFAPCSLKQIVLTDFIMKFSPGPNYIKLPKGIGHCCLLLKIITSIKTYVVNTCNGELLIV